MNTPSIGVVQKKEGGVSNLLHLNVALTHSPFRVGRHVIPVRFVSLDMSSQSYRSDMQCPVPVTLTYHLKPAIINNFGRVRTISAIPAFPKKRS